MVYGRFTVVDTRVNVFIIDIMFTFSAKIYPICCLAAVERERERRQISGNYRDKDISQ